MPQFTTLSALNVRLLAGQVVSYTPATAVPALISLLSSAIFTRLLSAVEYGQYSLVLSITTVATAVAVQWLQQGVNRYLPAATTAEGRDHIKQALVLGLVSAQTVVVLAGAVFMAVFQEFTFTFPALLMVALGAVFGPTGVVFQAEMRGWRYTVFHVSSVALRFLLSLLLMLLVHPHPSILIWGNVLSLGVLIPFAWRRAALPSVPDAFRAASAKTWSVLGRLAAYGLPMAGWFLTSNLLSAGDRYVIQWFRGSAEVGIYSANYQLISGVVGLVTTPVLLAAHPFLMRAWGDGNAEKARHWLGWILESLAVLGIAAVALTTVFSADLARWFLGQEFRSGHVVMPLVLAGVVVWNIAMYLHKPLEFHEHTTCMLASGLVAAVLNLVLNVAFVPSYGYMAAAWTTIVSYAVYAGVVGMVGRRRLRWSLRWSRLAQVAGWGIGLVAAAGWARDFAMAAAGYWGGLAATLMVALSFGVGLVGLVWKSIIIRAVHARDGREH